MGRVERPSIANLRGVMILRGSVPTTSSRDIHTFSRSPQADIPRSKFNRSHGVKTTFNEGYLVPILVDEMLPGDTFSCKLHAFVRFATPTYPIMDNMYLETFFFAVPYRLVWNHWVNFNGEQANPGDSISYTVPTCTAPGGGVGVSTGELQDYMGIPIKIASLVFDNLHCRAYNLIYNQWFRDQNMQNSVTVDTGDGPDTYGNYVLLRRGKRYDYFTSCLPAPQRGPNVTLPLGSQAIIKSTGAVDSQGRTPIKMYPINDASAADSRNVVGNAATNILAVDGVALGASNQLMWPLSTDNFYDYADLSTATAATINAIRLAFQTQKLLERDARGGTRYTEIIRSHFSVSSPDMRLQRAEYIGGGSTPVIINPVAQTSATSGSNPLGLLAAYGICAPEGHGFTYSATEHVLILGLVSVRADLNYQQGLERMWSRQTRYDYFWPAFSHIGEQSVLNQEIYAQGPAGGGADAAVFGYQERHAEYRYKPSQITGLFRSTATGTLHAWHLAQNFGSLPTLNSTFIVENPDMSRIKAITTEPDFKFDGFLSYQCARPMPTYAVPGLIDHF